MTIGKRPGGLTALAIIHLVFGALGVLGLIMVAGMLALLNSGVMDDILEEAAEDAETPVEAPVEPDVPEVTDAADRDEPPEIREFREMFQGPGKAAILANLFLSLVATVLQIISAIGYLGQKRVLGRYVGNAYGILSMVAIGVSLAVPQPGASQWMILTNMVLPVITLVLINTTFKDDLVH